MTPEERFAKIDRHIAAAAMHLNLSACIVHATDATFEQRVDKLLVAVEKDAENIRALARIAGN
jgi:hypothetical protein